MLKIIKMIVNKILSSIFINTLVIYIISNYITWLDFKIIFSSCSFEIYLFIWSIFWFLDFIIKNIVKILSFPLNILTLWIFWIIINILFLYLFAYIINNYINNIAEVQIWSIIQVFIVSIIIYILNLLFKKL